MRFETQYKLTQCGIGVVFVMIASIILLGIFMPNSWVQTLSESGLVPDEHYEGGQRIRTVRGQDFIVTGYGDHERLVPIAPEGGKTTVVIVKTNYVRVEQ